MKIALIGDSWAVPNRFPSWENCFPPEAHLQQHLKNLGHEIYNFAQNGGSNLHSLKNLETAITQNYYWRYELLNTDWHRVDLKEKFNCDLVIWFFTEWVRDCIPKGPKYYGNYTLDSLEKIMLAEIFSYAKNLKNQMDAKWLLIGGQAAVPQNADLLGVNDFIIYDWRSDIVQEKLPYVPYVSIQMDHIKFIMSPNCKNTLEEKEGFFNRVEYIMSKMTEDKFWDACHPGAGPHKDLSDFIQTNIINNNENFNTRR